MKIICRIAINYQNENQQFEVLTNDGLLQLQKQARHS